MLNTFALLTTPLCGGYYPFRANSYWHTLDNSRQREALPETACQPEYVQSVLDSQVSFAVALDVAEDTIWVRRLA